MCQRTYGACAGNGQAAEAARVVLHAQLRCLPLVTRGRQRQPLQLRPRLRLLLLCRGAAVMLQDLGYRGIKYTHLLQFNSACKTSAAAPSPAPPSLLLQSCSSALQGSLLRHLPSFLGLLSNFLASRKETRRRCADAACASISSPAELHFSLTSARLATPQPNFSCSPLPLVHAKLGSHWSLLRSSGFKKDPKPWCADAALNVPLVCALLLWRLGECHIAPWI